MISRSEAHAGELELLKRVVAGAAVARHSLETRARAVARRGGLKRRCGVGLKQREAALEVERLGVGGGNA